MTANFHKLRPILALAFCISPFSALSDNLDSAINTDLATNKANIKSQKKVASLNDQSRAMLDEYRSITRQAETLRTYNKHLQDLVASQELEKSSLQKQLADIEITQREIVPLILRMLENLEAFIELDLPFLPEERQKRLANLKQMVLRADVTNAEKFRRILEAFQIENDFGKTIEAYRANLTLNNTESSVDFLRIGRIALYYRRLDGSETGLWNKEKKAWESLSSDYNIPIRNALRIARKEVAPDLIALPVLAAEAVQ
jgi:septal ring factor EnvC (AmiA/AmiB activator)